MKATSLRVALLAISIFVPAVTEAQNPAATGDSAFRFEIAEVAHLHRGPAVEGFLYNRLSWRITNVRLRIDSVDPAGQVTSQAYGWVLGDVSPGNRAYFFVPVSAYGATYRGTVVSFDRVSIEAP